MDSGKNEGRWCRGGAAGTKRDFSRLKWRSFIVVLLYFGVQWIIFAFPLLWKLPWMVGLSHWASRSGQKKPPPVAKQQEVDFFFTIIAEPFCFWNMQWVTSDEFFPSPVLLSARIKFHYCYSTDDMILVTVTIIFSALNHDWICCFHLFTYVFLVFHGWIEFTCAMVFPWLNNLVTTFL